MRFRIVALVVLAALTVPQAQRAACQENTSPKSDQNCQLTETDYAVYAGLLNDLGGPEDPEESWSGKEFVLVDTTAGGTEDAQRRDWGFRSKSKESPHADTIADFTAKKNERCTVKSGFGDPKSYSIVPSTEIDGYFPKTVNKKKDGWKAFYEKHLQAGGFWRFSRPGYNSDRDEALVYVSHSCGWLCGTGHFYLLSKQSGAWKVRNRLMLWIS
jgi:hypothetical protein